MSIFTEEAIKSTLTLSQNDLLRTSWQGLAPPSLSNLEVICARTFPSAKSSGYVHYSAESLRSGEEWFSKRAMLPGLVGIALDMILEKFGQSCCNLSWKATSALPPDHCLPKARATASVYFIQAIGGGLVKIGVSSSPQFRLASLQCGCPVELRIIKTIDVVPRTVETDIHKRFAKYRVRGEWFDPIVLTLEAV